MFENCASFTDSISEIDYTEVDHAKDSDKVMPIYNLIEYKIFIQKHWEVSGETVEMKQL